MSPLNVELSLVYAVVNPRLAPLLIAAAVGAVAAAPFVLAAIGRRRRARARAAPRVRIVRPAPGPAAPEEGAAREDGRDDPISPGRRRFFAAVGAAAGGLAAAIVAVPFLGVLFAPVRRREGAVWRPLGALDDFPVGETVRVEFLDPAPVQWAGFAAQGAAWLRRERGQEFVAFSAYCTHIGCPVRWMPDANLFLCPCHGGAFYQDGAVASGPPPEPLFRHTVRVRDGQVEILATPIPLPTDRG